MQKTDLESIDLLVQKSLQEHGEIFLSLQELGGQLDTHSTDHINELNRVFSGIQSKARRTDEKLTDLLKVIDIPENIAALLIRRTVIQQKTLVLLKEISSRANSVKSLLASEMQSIKHGRQALSGYRIDSDYNGKIINKAS